MSDTPDVLDAPRDLMRAARIVRSSSWPIDMAASMEALADRLDWLADHLGAGYVLVKADGLSHGDELVRVDGLRVTGTQDAPTFNQEPVWRRLRRSVPERRCSTCDGRKVVEGHAWRRIDETTGFPARELVPCPACSVPENGDT